MPRSAGELLGILTVPILLVAGAGIYLGIQAAFHDPPWLWVTGAILCIAGLVAMMWPVYRALDRIES
jgi:phosphotransferase system  glucose/maltose/N-acetylglucosamine-specific IIC component